MREGNPNVVSFFLVLLGPNIYQPKYLFFPFIKGVGPYNPAQSKHYNINLICPVIQPLILDVVVIINYIFTCLYVL